MILFYEIYVDLLEYNLYIKVLNISHKMLLFVFVDDLHKSIYVI
jgi:hypothetical protein